MISKKEEKKRKKTRQNVFYASRVHQGCKKNYLNLTRPVCTKESFRTLEQKKQKTLHKRISFCVVFFFLTVGELKGVRT